MHTYIRTYIHTYIYMYWHATHHTPVCHPGRRPDSDCGRWSRFDGRQLKSFKRCETSSSFDFDHPCEVSRCANVTTAWAATKNKESWWGLQISPRATYKNGLNMKLWTWLFPPITSSCLLLERVRPTINKFQQTLLSDAKWRKCRKIGFPEIVAQIMIFNCLHLFVSSFRQTKATWKSGMTMKKTEICAQHECPKLIYLG